MKRIKVNFFQTSSGAEPVKDWLRTLKKEDMHLIGEQVKKVEFGWPLGMPLVRKMEENLWEVRCNVSGNIIARMLFTVVGSFMILLHGFIKKSQKTPTQDLSLARKRARLVIEEAKNEKK